MLLLKQVYAHYDDMKKSTTLKVFSSALDNDKEDKKEIFPSIQSHNLWGFSLICV